VTENTNSTDKAKKKSGWRWGAGVILLNAGFVVFILIMVGIASFQDVDLVESDYYEKEMTYQNRIDAINRTNTMDTSLAVSYHPETGQLMLVFPERLANSEITGTLTLYRPSNSRWDRVFDIDIDSTGQQLITTDKLIPGLWRIKIDWSIDDQYYYTEEKLIIR
jgi:hypothetical protein